MSELLDTQVENIVAWTDRNITDGELREKMQQGAKDFIETFKKADSKARKKLDIRIMASSLFLEVALVRRVRKSRTSPTGEQVAFSAFYSNDFHKTPGAAPKRLRLTTQEIEHRGIDAAYHRLRSNSVSPSPMREATMHYLLAHRGLTAWERTDLGLRGKSRVWGYQGDVLMELLHDTRHINAICRLI